MVLLVLDCSISSSSNVPDVTIPLQFHQSRYFPQIFTLNSWSRCSFSSSPTGTATATNAAAAASVYARPLHQQPHTARSPTTTLCSEQGQSKFPKAGTEPHTSTELTLINTSFRSVQKLSSEISIINSIRDH